MINLYILGNAIAIKTITPSELRDKHRHTQSLIDWGNKLIDCLIDNKLQVDDLLVIIYEYQSGNIHHIKRLGILPDDLHDDIKLGTQYLAGLVYMTFKRNIITKSTFCQEH